MINTVIVTSHREIRAESSAIWAELVSLDHKNQGTKAKITEVLVNFLEGLETAKGEFKMQLAEDKA